MAAAHRVSQIPKALYPIFRLVAVFGPTDDKGLVLRARNHGVRDYRRAVAGARQLERDEIFRREGALWKVAYDRLV